MSFLFKSKQKSPSELVKQTKDLILKLEGGGGADYKKPFPFKRNDNEKQLTEDISKNLLAMKNLLYGDGGIDFFYIENDPVPELVTQLATEVVASNILVLLVQNFQLFEFEVS
jgi:calcium binding protein 39